jgi:hypothetical protein
MSLWAVLDYVKDQVDDLPSTYYGNSKAKIMPDVPGKTDPGTPLIHVFTNHLSEKRQTMPRASNAGMGGYKKSRHSVDLFVLVTGKSTGAYADQAFPIFLEAVMAKLRSVELTIPITDPDTGAASTILSIGEEFEVEIAPVVTIATQRMVAWQSRITCPVDEAFFG